MKLPSPKRAKSDIARLVDFIRQHPGKRFSDSDLEKQTGLPKVTASNAKKGGYVYRAEDGRYYYPTEAELANTETISASDSTSTSMREDKDMENRLLKQAIQRKIEEHQRQIEILKDMLKSY